MLSQKESPYRGKKVLVLGLGLSGRAAAHFLLEQGAFVWGTDCNTSLLEKHVEILALKKDGAVIQQESHVQNVGDFDFMILSPGIPFTHPLYQAARQIGKE